MPFRFDADRRLVCLAADAARVDELARVDDRPWRRSASRPSDRPAGDPPSRRDPRPGRPLDVEIVRAIEAVVVGDAGQLASVLTEDAVGWSPSFAFRSRRDAISAATELATELHVVAFRLVRVLDVDDVVVAEWWATVELTGPLLVGGDVLVEPSGRPADVRGVTIADRRGARIEAIATYFDQARLIEQVILDG